MVQWLRICLPMQGIGLLIPGQGTKIPHAAEQLRMCVVTTEPFSASSWRARVPQPDIAKNKQIFKGISRLLFFLRYLPKHKIN